ncbi:hypothetical protein BDV38DRAFT_278388 [Aspergillus pseudotamarii]|uniref:Uncharacterized protein n=1 Tax=Aspergillus pseudotamarii TaxID=132259 RepID=A0A5N6T7K9_ASPPS|nr:uncharacterized protein BDV38DRAFT_278388 [Aspergillus pseudotamarii]KAE8142216.1 hypothetical protein BDV38DRAFT_278388 [Aspergillus pseudotamarii]
MVPGSSSALKASRGVTSKVLSSTTQGALSGETLSKSGAYHPVQEQRPSAPSKGDEKGGKVDRIKETSLKQSEAPTKPQSNQRVSTTQNSMESKLNTTPKPASQGISSESLVGHSQPQQPSQADGDRLTTFPPFAVGPKDKVKKFLESQGLGDSSDTPQQSAIDHLRSRPPTPWPGAAVDPESLQSADDARPPVPSHQLPRVSTAIDELSNGPLLKSTVSTKPEELSLKDLGISQPDIPLRPLPPISTSRFSFLPREDDISIVDDPALLTPITEVPSELSRANSPVDPLIGVLKPRPIVEQPNPPVKKPPVQKPAKMPASHHAAPAAREVPKPHPPPSSTVLSSIPDRPGTPQVTVGLLKPKQKTPVSSASPQARPNLASAKKLERKPSKLNIATSSGAMENDSRRQSETISGKQSDNPNVNPPQQRLSSPFNPLKTNQQAWDLETIASEDSWFQENEDSDGSGSGESGPRRTPPGPVRARLTVETVECTFQPPAQTPDLDQAQYDGMGQTRNEFFPPWAVGSQALSEGARDLRT